MTTQSEVQVSRLLDERGLSSFQINLLIWSFFIVLIDGYDIAAIAFAAPHLVRAWGVTPGALGPVFSASLVGILFGSAFFGWVGDRYGRKAALIGSNLWFGIFTLAAAYSSNLDQMFWLRLLAGLGIGGVIPNVVAVNAESAPRHLRATLAIIAVGCVPIGGAIPGFVAAALVPTYGWPILFQIGGIVPILIAVAAMFGLPESIKYMALHERHRRGMEALVSAIRPDFKVPANARFVIEDEKQFPGFNPIYLFRQGLALITPLLWLLFALNLMGIFLSAELDPDAAHRRQAATDARGARRRDTPGGRDCRRLDAVLVVAAASFPRHHHHVRTCCAGGRLDRVCGTDLGSCAADGDVLRRLLGAGHPVGHQRRRSDDLSDLFARQRLRMGIGDWPDRLNRWSPGRGNLCRPAGPDSLYVGGPTVRDRSGDLLHHSSAQYGASCGASRTARGTVRLGEDLLVCETGKVIEKVDHGKCENATNESGGHRECRPHSIIR
jgi:MFS family permease